MAAFEALKEDIVDVFQLFDEDGSGCISMEEVTRAIHTITGTHLSRIDLYSLIKAAKEDMNEEARVKGGQEGQCGPAVAKTTDGSGSQGADTEPDVVDSDLFVALVLKTLNRRTYEQELLFTFHLLEDKNYPGFITKESLKSATSDVGERLTEQEVNEMFDKLVTGVPTAAVDFTTFLSILDAARKLGD